MLNIDNAAGASITLPASFGQWFKAGVAFSAGAALVVFISLLVWTQVMPYYALLSVRALFGR